LRGGFPAYFKLHEIQWDDGRTRQLSWRADRLGVIGWLALLLVGTAKKRGPAARLRALYGLKSASKPRPAETPLPGIGDRGRGAGENVGAPLLRWGTDASGEEGSGVCQDQAGSEHNAQTAQETTFPWSQARQERTQVSIVIIFGFGPATSDLVRWFEACVTETPATRAIIIVSFSHCFTMCVSPFVCAGAFARSWV
jgi:hypothetical protein